MPSQLDRAPDQNFDEFIGGLNIPEWGGVNQHDAPHLMPSTDFQHLENVIIEGTEVKPRGGQSKYKASVIASGYVLWGGYGGVMQHGGIGGIGFADEPSEETPDTFVTDAFVLVWI